MTIGNGEGAESSAGISEKLAGIPPVHSTLMTAAPTGGNLEFNQSR